MLLLLLLQIVLSKAVSFDSRSILLNGKQEIILAGTIHYPRSTPDMWPELFAETKAAGLNAIDTYVFWDQHEAQRGKYNFEGSLDLVKFIKEAEKAGLYVILRIGPYVCAEWTLGGIPLWVRELPGVEFRTINEPFQNAMASFVSHVVDLVKPLLFDNKGPIIMLQIENEYGNIQSDYGVNGQKYIEWAVDFAQNQTDSALWFVCQQNNVPKVLNTCNGFYCDNWIGDRPFTAQMAGWTENWTGWFQRWGESRPSRPAEDIAFAVARFIARGGTYIGYYMWHGGTNFGRTGGGPFITTTYDYDAPLDEFGNRNEPKFSHLSQLHRILGEYSSVLLSTKPIVNRPQNAIEIHTYENKGKKIVFLSNYDSSNDVELNFQGKAFKLPKWSVTLVDENLQVLFCTSKTTVPSTKVIYEPISSLANFSYRPEPVGIHNRTTPITNKYPLEQISAAGPNSDYLLYATSVLISGKDASISIDLRNVQDLATIFLDDEFVTDLAFEQVSVSLPNRNIGKDQKRTLYIYSQTVGLANYGSFLNRYKRGLQGPIKVNGVDVTKSVWMHQVGLFGENEGFSKAANQFTPKNDGKVARWGWYAATFDVKIEAASKFALDLASMGKGEVWINDQSLGRYWNITGTGMLSNKKAFVTQQTPFQRPQSFSSLHFVHSLQESGCNYAGTYSDSKCRGDPLSPSQRFYHIPKAWLKPQNNKIVFWAQQEGDLSQVKVVKVIRQ